MFRYAFTAGPESSTSDDSDTTVVVTSVVVAVLVLGGVAAAVAFLYLKKRPMRNHLDNASAKDGDQKSITSTTSTNK